MGDDFEMSSLKRHVTTGVVGMLAASLLAACGSTTATGATPASGSVPSHSGTLTIGTYTSYETFDPATSHTLLDQQIMDNIYGTLLQVSPQGQLVPNLATHVAVSSSGLQYVISLQHGVKFQDGTPFNAAAVKYNWERIINPKTASVQVSNLGPVTSIVVNSTYQLTVNFSKPFAPFMDNLAGPVGMIASPTAIQSEGSSFGSHPVGAGPFKFQSWVPNGAVTLVRNASYWKSQKPSLNKVVFDPILSASTLVDALDSGQVQIADVLGPSQLGQVQSSVAHVSQVAGLGWFGLNLNQTSGPLSNVHNRRAVQYAINRAVVRNLVFHGTGALAYSQFSPTSWAYNPNLTIPFSDTKAKQELSKAGNPQGFSFTVQAQNTSKYILLTQILQSELAKVGITMHIQLLALSTYITNLNSGAYQADFINMSGSLDPNSVSYIFDETSADVVKDGFDDPTVNNLLNAALATPNQAQRKADYQTIASRMAKDVPMVDLINPAIIVGVSNKVHGFINFPTQYFYLGRVSLGSK